MKGRGCFKKWGSRSVKTIASLPPLFPFPLHKEPPLVQSPNAYSSPTSSSSLQATLYVLHAGWKTLVVPPCTEPCSVVRIEVSGQQNKVRVRQIQVLAPPIKSLDSSSSPATVAQQKACEAEALKVFRSLTSQVSQQVTRKEKMIARLYFYVI